MGDDGPSLIQRLIAQELCKPSQRLTVEVTPIVKSGAGGTGGAGGVRSAGGGNDCAATAMAVRAAVEAVVGDSTNLVGGADIASRVTEQALTGRYRYPGQQRQFLDEESRRISNIMMGVIGRRYDVVGNVK